MTAPKTASERKGKSSKLKEKDVRTIRELHAKGLQSVREMAQFYGVGAETIRRAVRGETWNDLAMSPPKTEEELRSEAEKSAQRVVQLAAALGERKAASDKMLNEIKSIPIDPLEERS